MVINKLSRKKEDYIKAIQNIIEKNGSARTKDIAKELNIKPPSVSEMLTKLQKEKVINYEKNRPITLTNKGKKIAEEITEEYQVLSKLLINLLVPEEIALIDACNMEHHLHHETVTQLKKFVKFIESVPDKPKWLSHFSDFCKSGIHEYKEREEQKIEG
ncbi:MAG: metal-dependent transcriptional regulator [Candidatus Helarchaeota archaeon]|nr:metal-dependent transcriptional regulator [Candidatus Helarchaeota archaeon]